jgi:transposase, IS5 family
LRQSAVITVGRYRHAHQFKRARRALKFLRIRLGRVIRDTLRKIADSEALRERFADLLALAMRVRLQDHRQRGRKVYALHAPEVECIGKGKARALREFGCRVSVATPATKPKSLPSRKRGAGSSCCTPRRCTAIPLTGAPWGRWWPSWKR